MKNCYECYVSTISFPCFVKCSHFSNFLFFFFPFSTLTAEMKTKQNKFDKLTVHCVLVGAYQRVAVITNKITLEIE